MLSLIHISNKGFLTAADEFTGTYTKPAYHFDKKIYENRVFDSKGVADPSLIHIFCSDLMFIKRFSFELLLYGSLSQVFFPFGSLSS